MLPSLRKKENNVLGKSYTSIRIPKVTPVIDFPDQPVIQSYAPNVENTFVCR